MLRFIVFTWLVSGSVALAQTDDCVAALNSQLNHIQASSRTSSSLNAIYDQNCSNNSYNHSSGGSLSLNAVVEEIPVGLKGGFNESSQAMNSFCSTYKSSAYATASGSDYETSVAAGAFTAFAQCKALAANNIYVTHDLIDDSKSQVTMRAGVGAPIVVSGVSTTANVSCTGQTSGGQSVKFTPATHISSTVSIGMFCTRAHRQAADGSTVYDEGSVAINVPPGRYNFVLPKSQTLPDASAAAINEKINAVAFAVNARLSTLDARPVLNVSSVGPNPDGDPNVKQCVMHDIGSPSQQKSCPIGFYVAGFQGAQNNNQALDVFVCCPLSK